MLIIARLAIALFVVLLGSQEAFSQDCKGVDIKINKKGLPPDSTFTYSFDPNVPPAARDAFSYAFHEWNMADAFSGLGIRFSHSEQPGNFQIAMAATSGNVAMSSSWAFAPGGHVGGGIIIVTTNTTLLDSAVGYYKGALHEIGHMHGFADRPGKTDRKSVMNLMSGKNDVGNAMPLQPTSCDATEAVQASRNWNKSAYGGGVGNLDGGDICPGGGCVGYNPFPPQCSGTYNPEDAWCYPGGTRPESFPNYGGRVITYRAPLVIITSPGNGATVGSTVDIRVATADTDGRVMGVAYYANGQLVHQTFTHPFYWTVQNAPPGTYTLQAVAFDNQGLEGRSTPITFTVNGSGGTPPGGGGGGGGGDYRLSPGERLYGGQRVYSGNGSMYLEHQGDGNLVLYGPGGPRWASMAFGGGGYTEMQSDGNVVSYNGSGVPIWATMTFSPGSTLSVQDDGNLVLYNSSSVPICLLNALQPGEQCP